jgi:hypothetical protein
VNKSVEEIGAKMDALGLWELLMPFNWAVKPHKTVFPYFCSVFNGDGKTVKVRFMMLEGWQTLHDYVHVRIDRNFGFYSSPMEMPQLELVIATSGEIKLFRHDPGFMPQEANPRQRALAEKILWEAYGVMMRVEADRQLPMKFASERSIFARVETAQNTWEDKPLEIPPSHPYVEKITFDNADLSKAKDLPIVADEALEIDFRMVNALMTKEPRPRCVYELLAVDPATREKVMHCRVSVDPESGLKGMWESVPVRLLKGFIERGRVPGLLKVTSGRVFRMLRPLCMELPFKLSLHDSLPLLQL